MQKTTVSLWKYIGDVTGIFSYHTRPYVKHFRHVFERFRLAKLKVKPIKCILYVKVLSSLDM